MSWSGFQLDVPTLQYRLVDQEVYEYKLPYSMPSAPWCTRIHPALYCCDRTCCRCLPDSVAPVSFIDVVDQETGHQLRYRAKKACCRVPRVLTFADGQYVGHLSRTMRRCNACYTCWEDYNSKPVLEVALHDADGKQFARIDRDGRGGCCECACKAPMKCTGCWYTCFTCTCACRPSAPARCGGFHKCDPVCCDCCVQGEKTACACFDTPCCCIGLPLCMPACWYPWPAIETKRLKNTGTAKYRDFDVISTKDNHQVGKVQALYRGNYPAAYTHSSLSPWKITGHSQDTTIGMLLSGIAAGMAYPMGDEHPVFDGLTGKGSGTSPDFDGKVFVTSRSQIERLLGMDGYEPALREDLCVGIDLVLGEKLMGVQVKGWRLVEFGYSSAAIIFRGRGILGASRAPRNVQSIEQVKDMVKAALETQLGEHGTTFKLTFELPDQEKGVCKRGKNAFGELNALADGFNPLRQGFIEQLEEVACACNAIRICGGCCNFSTKDKVVCCRCPLYARPYNIDNINRIISVVPSAWEAVPPPHVVMVGAPKERFWK